MKLKIVPLLIGLLLLTAVPELGAGPLHVPHPGAETGGKIPGEFKLIGHNPLENRGMNAAIAIHGNYAYIGSRTDGLHPNTEVKVVDISKPSDPKIVGEIGMPNEGNVGETSRELRVWPEKDLLIVLNLASNCSYLIHACSPTSAVGADNFRFYDISKKNAESPKLVSEYRPSVDPHEFFVWDDPKKKGRALLFMSTPGGGGTQLMVTDMSDATKGKFTELDKWTTVIPDTEADRRLHSLTVSNDGKRGYLAYLGGGFFIVDTSEFAKGVKEPEVKQVTPIPNRVHWGNPGVHSAVKLFGRDWVMTTDEVYGEIPGLLSEHGCPWGWVRFVDISDPKKPKVASEYRLGANHEEFCDDPTANSPDRNSLSSWSAHNPTVVKSIALLTWHSAGLQAIDTTNPRKPKQLAYYRPEPLAFVTQEDPLLSSGQDKVVMWSFPIIKDGLIYVVDVRNGLYILKYKGPHEKEIARIDFLEGNSNLGDALRLEKP